MSYLPGKFNWFEHLSTGPAQASEFHQALFGWKFRRSTATGARTS